MSKYAKILVCVAVFLMAIAILAVIYAYNKLEKSGEWSRSETSIAGNKLHIYLADTEAKREEGLSSFKGLSDQEGMLFLFDQAGNYQFWMKGMSMPIDIIWINNNKVIGITPDIPVQTGAADNELKKYAPPSEVDKVLEVRAGWTKKYGIEAGNNVE